ncbi:MAG: carbohydrate ABC transporter permease [Chloroflexi bacterium]|nr:carbohydrate ABC transporter permease [Chloroflexota bacterium]
MIHKTTSDVPPTYERVPLYLQAISYVLLLVGGAIMLLPFVWMVSTACKPPQELTRIPVTFIPENQVCRANFDGLYERVPLFNKYLLNSALMTAGRTLGQMITCSLAAYGFARFRFPGRNVLFALCLALLMVPLQAFIIQEFILINDFGWRDTFYALIVPGTFSAFALFLLRQAFMQIPIELEEAAMIDGANPLQVLFHITLPLSVPALAAFGVITVQAAWNDFLWPLVVSYSPGTRVLPVGLSFLIGQRNTPFNLLMMGSFLGTLPMLILFLLLQRYFIEGISMTGVKR